ncbi:hypothetical protein [Neobacillus sp. NPDC093127]|uniref:hypothetical protein n=1 Tax=Neobacillus sp. NPDC093127 TaxID=3364296 RepID=UPI0037FB0197
MSKNSTPEKVEIVKVDPNDVQLVEKNESSNNSSSGLRAVGKEIGTTIIKEFAKAAVPATIEMVKGKIDDDREEKKKIFEDRRAILQRDFNVLIQNIEKEEAKENYNQERINNWYERVDKIKQELSEMQEKTDGFAKGLLNSIKEFLSKSGRTK